MTRPMIHGDLADAAAALLLAQDSRMVGAEEYADADGKPVFYIDETLAVARDAASAYLVACFTYATTAIDDDEDDPE